VERLIRVAIRERRLLEFVLHGLRRIAEPHLLGARLGPGETAGWDEVLETVR
jgi:hypothetical protein